MNDNKKPADEQIEKRKLELLSELNNVLEEYLIVKAKKEKYGDTIAEMVYYFLDDAKTSYKVISETYTRTSVAALKIFSKHPAVTDIFRKEMLEEDFEEFCDMLGRITSFMRSLFLREINVDILTQFHWDMINIENANFCEMTEELSHYKRKLKDLTSA